MTTCLLTNFGAFSLTRRIINLAWAMEPYVFQSLVLISLLGLIPWKSEEGDKLVYPAQEGLQDTAFRNTTQGLAHPY